MRTVETKVDVGNWLERNPETVSALVGDRTQVATAMKLIEQNFTTAIRETKAPVTLIWGRDDPIAPLRTGRLLAGRLTEAQLHVLDGVGHVPMTGASAPFNQIMTTSLTAPINAREPALASASEQGDLVCKQKAKLRFTGRIRSLRLRNCARIRIEDAELDYLQIDESTADLNNVKVANTRTALLVRDSTITGTTMNVTGEIGIHADNSLLDLAGVSVKGSKQALKLSADSTIYFSVSELESPELAVDAHDIWGAAVREKSQL